MENTKAERFILMWYTMLLRSIYLSIDLNNNFPTITHISDYFVKII